MKEKLNRVKRFCKDHKDELITGGLCIIGLTGLGFCGYKLHIQCKESEKLVDDSIEAIKGVTDWVDTFGPAMATIDTAIDAGATELLCTPTGLGESFKVSDMGKLGEAILNNKDLAGAEKLDFVSFVFMGVKDEVES